MDIIPVIVLVILVSLFLCSVLGFIVVTVILFGEIKDWFISKIASNKEIDEDGLMNGETEHIIPDERIALIREHQPFLYKLINVTNNINRLEKEYIKRKENNIFASNDEIVEKLLVLSKKVFCNLHLKVNNSLGDAMYYYWYDSKNEWVIDYVEGYDEGCFFNIYINKKVWDLFNAEVKGKDIGILLKLIFDINLDYPMEILYSENIRKPTVNYFTGKCVHV